MTMMMRCGTELFSTWRCSNRSRRRYPQHISSTVRVCAHVERGGREREGVGGRGSVGEEWREGGEGEGEE